MRESGRLRKRQGNDERGGHRRGTRPTFWLSRWNGRGSQGLRKHQGNDKRGPRYILKKKKESEAHVLTRRGSNRQGGYKANVLAEPVEWQGGKRQASSENAKAMIKVGLRVHTLKKTPRQ